MSPAWGLVLTGIMTALAVAGLIWRDGRRDGRTDTILERLTAIAEDHETRLRDVEHGSRARRRSSLQPPRRGNATSAASPPGRRRPASPPPGPP
jgi:hypothetical protein